MRVSSAGWRTTLIEQVYPERVKRVEWVIPDLVGDPRIIEWIPAYAGMTVASNLTI